MDTRLGGCFSHLLLGLLLGLGLGLLLGLGLGLFLSLGLGLLDWKRETRRLRCLWLCTSIFFHKCFALERSCSAYQS